jgi:hypothetical protein
MVTQSNDDALTLRHVRAPLPFPARHVPWVQAEHARVPDRGFAMSAIRSGRRKYVTFLTTAIARAALAGSVVATSLAPVRPLAAAPTAPAAIRLADALIPPAATNASPAAARAIARAMLASFHWRQRQFKYLNRLWDNESGWNVLAVNPHSGAYGIPQADPGSKMASAGPNWRTSARTQIRWGLGYIQTNYGSPRRAWAHELATGWY